MYEMVEYALVGIIALIGIFMAICPRYAVKQEERQNESRLANTRRKGIMLVVVAVLCEILLIIGE